MTRKLWNGLKSCYQRVSPACEKVAELYRLMKRSADAINIYEFEYNFGFVWTVDELFQLYATEDSIKNFDKASDWLARLP